LTATTVDGSAMIDVSRRRPQARRLVLPMVCLVAVAIVVAR
jgi:hypothetical protein